MRFRRPFRRARRDPPAPPLGVPAGPDVPVWQQPTEAYPGQVLDEEVVEPAVVEEYGPPVPPPDEPPPDRNLWPWLALLLLVVLGGLAALYFLSREDDPEPRDTVVVTTGRQSATVPRVIGLTQSAAVRRLRVAGLSSRIVRRPSRAARGIVFAQRPRPGATVPAGDGAVTLSVSARQVVVVPRVEGLRASLAVQRLRAAGLTARVENVFAGQPPGIVVSQEPGAGERVARGSSVAVRASRGPQRVTVPDVTGETQAAAQRRIRAVGLTPFVFRVPAEDVPEGSVVAQLPLGGRRVEKGSRVRINVSTGPPADTGGGGGGGGTTTAPRTVTVPNVVGVNQTVAQRRLQAAGLAVTISYVTSARPEGQVIAQSPAGGSTAERGSRVRISVSTGPRTRPLVAVPDVVGLDEQTAAADLRRAGFRVQAIPAETVDETQEGMVIDQQPEGGTRAPRGAQVTIYVGRFTG